jgi:hypothetical protein
MPCLRIPSKRASEQASKRAGVGVGVGVGVVVGVCARVDERSLAYRPPSQMAEESGRRDKRAAARPLVLLRFPGSGPLLRLAFRNTSTASGVLITPHFASFRLISHFDFRGRRRPRRGVEGCTAAVGRRGVPLCPTGQTHSLAGPAGAHAEQMRHKPSRCMRRAGAQAQMTEESAARWMR